jgi:peptide/nickel transport system permease protein
VLGPVLVIATINLALAVIEEATLSFLGVGVPPTQSLARHTNPCRSAVSVFWRMVDSVPSIALIILSLSINLLGDWLARRL